MNRYPYLKLDYQDRCASMVFKLEFEKSNEMMKFCRNAGSRCKFGGVKTCCVKPASIFLVLCR